MKKKQRPGSLSSMADVMSKVSRQLDLDSQVQKMSLLALWSTVVPNELAERSQATAVRKQGVKTVLHVQVSDAVTASELSFRQEEIKTALNRYAPQTGICLDSLYIKVGNLRHK